MGDLRFARARRAVEEEQERAAGEADGGEGGAAHPGAEESFDEEELGNSSSDSQSAPSDDGGGHGPGVAVGRGRGAAGHEAEAPDGEVAGGRGRGRGRGRAGRGRAGGGDAGRGRGRGRGGAAYDSVAIHDPLDGEFLGVIKWNAAAKSLDAHCRLRNHRCRLNCAVNRTTQGGAAGSAQGRPLGMLVAWLRAGRHPDAIDRDSHFGMRSRADILSPVDRLEARLWVEDQPALADFRSKERQDLWPGEGLEPEGLC